MFIKFEDPNSDYYDMVEEWNERESMGKEPLMESHYELAVGSKFDATQWKGFLTHPQIADELNSEFLLMQQNKVRKLVGGLDSATRSTGQAQLINTLIGNIDKAGDNKNEGPAFIYTFVPVNAEQRHADNVVELDFNPFIKEEE